MRNIERIRIIIFLSLFLFTGCGVDYHFKNAERLKNEGKYREAITKYKRVIEKYPTNEYTATSQFTIANIYFYKIKNYQQAKIEYQIFLKNYSSDNRISKVNNEINKIIDLLSKAQENLQNQNIKEAIEEFGKVLELDADCPQGKQGLEQAKQEEIIEVKSGKITLCEDCGKTLRKNIKIVKVKRKEAGGYAVSEIRQGVCSSCRSAREERELVSEIVEYAGKFRELQRKYYAMRYEMNYKTPSSEIFTKVSELQRFAEYEYVPVALKFSYLISEYAQKYGGMALRDLAIKHNFLDLLR